MSIGVAHVMGDWSSGNLVIKRNAATGGGASTVVEFGQNDTGLDVKFYGDTASAYAMWDQSADGFLIAGDARLDFSSATVKAANTDGGIIRAGTSAANITEATANMKFVAVYTTSSATSGDSRAIYVKHTITGNGGAGEAIRAYGVLNATIGSGSVFNGIHATGSLGTSGVPTASGVNGVRATIEASAATRSIAGTCSALQVDSNIATGNTITGVYSLIRLAKSGAVDVPFFLDISDDQCLKGSAASGAAGDALVVRMPNGDTKYISLIAAS